MRPRQLLLCLILGVAAPVGTFCACSSPETANEFSQGQTVPAAVDEVWLATRSAMQGLGRGSKSFDEEKLEATALIEGQRVTVRIEEAGFRRTIVRVMTRDSRVAADVLQSITALLPR